MKQGPLSVWCHDDVAMVPFTTTHVNVGGAAMSEQIDQFKEMKRQCIQYIQCSPLRYYSTDTDCKLVSTLEYMYR